MSTFVVYRAAYKAGPRYQELFPELNSLRDFHNSVLASIPLPKVAEPKRSCVGKTQKETLKRKKPLSEESQRRFLEVGKLEQEQPTDGGKKDGSANAVEGGMSVEGTDPVRPDDKKSLTVWQKLWKTFAINSTFKKFSEFWDIWGTSVLVSLVIGAGTALLLVYLGFLPDCFISEKYQRDRVGGGNKPGQIELTTQAHTLQWLSFLTDRLESETRPLIAAGQAKGSTVCPMQSGDIGPSPQFRLVLEPIPNYQISSCLAFRVTSEGLYAELKPEGTNDTSKKFTVPELKKGDRLLAIISIVSTSNDTSGDCKQYFRSHSE